FTDDELAVPLTGRDSGGGPLIAGLIEQAPRFGDVEFAAALDDREHAIQLRAELLVDRAIAEGAPWLQDLGAPLPGRQEEWRARAVTVACFRDLYSVYTDEALGREHTHGKNRERDRLIAAGALRAESRAPSDS